MHRPDEILGRVNLDPVDPVQLGLAHRGPASHGELTFLFSVNPSKAQRLIVGIVGAGALIERLPDHLHPRTGDEPALMASRRSTVLNPPRESMSRTVVKPASRSICAFVSAMSAARRVSARPCSHGRACRSCRAAPLRR